MKTELDSVNGKEQELKRCIKEDKLYELHPKLSIRVAPDMPVEDVIQTMVDKKVGAVLIVENNELIGIFSERDIIRRVALDYDQAADRPIRDYMTKNPVKLSINDTIAFALNHMDVGDYRHIPIMDDQNLPTGMAAARDIIRYIDYNCLGGPE
ncbi:MAG: CBS domain-containing protein [Candidatus Omnitrophica bacterium]|nr:CBS domain-containing protein [Candidatus Omnitrophota bacterium]